MRFRGKVHGQGVSEAKPVKNCLCVVLGKWCDMWGKQTVRLELIPATLLPTNADTTHRMK